MKWEAWVLATLFAISSVYTVATVNKPADPNEKTPGSAAFQVFLTAILIWLVVRLGVA